MSAVAIELAVILILILINGFLAMSEISVVSARKARLQSRAEEGDARAARALRLAENPGTFLSTVQIGITSVGILTGVFGGATLARWLSAQLTRVPGLAAYADTISVITVVLTITFLTLLLGELTPKRIGLANAERLAIRVTPAMTVIARIASPIVRVLERSSNALLALLRIAPDDEPAVSDDEIRVLLAQGTRVGIFEPIEEQIVEQVFRMSDRTVAALLTPRPDIIWLAPNASMDEVRRVVDASGHSRFPVADGDLDRVVGVVTVKDLFTAHEDPDVTPRSVMRTALFVPETMPALRLLDDFRYTGAKMALVIDEYGGVSGLVTAGDLVEGIVGALPGPDALGDAEATQREDGSWLIDGMLPLDEFCSLFNVRMEDEDEAWYQTVGGLVMGILGRVPSAGEICVWQGLEIEVIDMDGRRVDKILVKLPLADSE
jgi:putative hemolysin